MFKILSTYSCCKKYIKCNIWRVAVRPSYIQDARFLKVKSCCIVFLHHPRCLNGMHYNASKNRIRLQFVQKNCYVSKLYRRRSIILCICYLRQPYLQQQPFPSKSRFIEVLLTHSKFFFFCLFIYNVSLDLPGKHFASSLNGKPACSSFN